nr:hypothetical protein [Tanacetum cinerariifolium]
MRRASKGYIRVDIPLFPTMLVQGLQVTPIKVRSQDDQPKDQLGVLSAAKILADATRVHTYSRRRRTISTGSGGVGTASRIICTVEKTVSIAGVSMPVSTGEDEWENIRERVEADEEVTQRLQAEEKEQYCEDDRTKMLVDLINQRKKFFAQQRAEAKRNKPMTQAQQRTYMSNYIKNMGSYTLKQLKKLPFEEIKELFEATMRRIQDFFPMERKSDKETDEASGLVQEQPVEKEKELSQEDLQQLMIIAPEQGMNIEALQVKYPIIDREIYTKDSRKYWKIVRTGNHTETYMHDPLKWRLYDTCGVPHVSTESGHAIFMLVEKDYPLTKGLMTVMLVNKRQVDEFFEMENELLRKNFILANNLKK